MPPAPALRPTAVVPPTPIPARNVTLWFESRAGDGALHPESRDVPAASDDVAFLRSVASGVVEGPRSEDLVSPFPDGWTLRGAYLLRDGVAVLDLAPPRPSAPAVLVEVSFISNADEEKKLMSDEFRRQVADTLAGSLETFFKAADGAAPVPYAPKAGKS